MNKMKHKYIFYFYPKNYPTLETPSKQDKGIFTTLGTVKEGKQKALFLKRKYDYKKIY